MTGEQGVEVAWIDHTASGVVLRTLGECKRLEDLPHGTKLYANPRSMGVPDGWTDEQCVKFMCVALRHVEYAKGTRGPTCDDIRLGLKLAAAPDGEVG